MSFGFATPVRVSLLLGLALSATASNASAQLTNDAAQPRFTHAWNFDEPAGSHVAMDATAEIQGTGGPHALWVSGEAPSFGAAHDKVVVMWPEGGADDRDTYVDFGNAAGAFGAGDFTVSHFFCTTHNASGTLADVIGNRTSYGHGNFFAVRMRGDGVLSVELDQDAAGTNYVGLLAEGVRVNDGRLHHLAYVRQGPMLSLYVDGALVKAAKTASSQPTFISGADSFRIGRRAPFAFTSIFAFYDDLHIYDHALTADQIQLLANGG